MRRQIPIRILIADDHPILREGIAAIIANETDMTLVGEAENGEQAVSMFDHLKPDIALMDIQMPVMDGLKALETIRHKHPAARIIMLTTYTGDAQATRALRAGASGYLIKSMLRKDLLATIIAVYQGRRVVPPEIATVVAEHIADEELSARELEILHCVADGCSNKEAAARLAVSEDTIKAHMKNILAKLRARDRTQAVTIALRRGIIEL